MNLTELLTLWIGEEDTTISLTELEKTYVNAGIRFKIKDLKSKIPDLIEQIEKHLMKEWEKIESKDEDNSMENWRRYKFIRNTTRDILKTLNK